jgi:hypothetical protein
MLVDTYGYECVTCEAFHREKRSFWYHGAMNLGSNLKDKIEKKVGEPDGTMQGSCGWKRIAYFGDTSLC